MTLRSGNCDSVLMRLSVRPSLRYSLLGSDVAFTKGSTATESIFLVSDRPCSRYTAAAAAATIASADTLNAKSLRDRAGVPGIAPDIRVPESTVAGALIAGA